MTFKTAIRNVAICALAGAAAMAAIPAQATTYIVNRSINGGTAVGTINTDNKIGVLAASNITSFSINVTLNGISQIINNSNATAYVSGSSLTASATSLNFNFDGAAGTYALFYANDARTFYCAQVSGCFSAIAGSGEGVRNTAFADTGVSRSGTLAIGSVTAAVPETATWGMMIAGFGMMGAAMRTRRRSTTVSFA